MAIDPNNKKWTGNTESFGLKLMTAQGWQPGDYLGAKDAKQAEHYTAGSSSHIRVMIKEDNLGLGAKIGSGVGHGECTGLDAFKDLLGRLNGKDEYEIEKEKKSREDLKRAIYSERKWGSTRFVKGGFLIGDKIQPLIEAEAERLRKLREIPLTTVQESSSSSSEVDEQTTVMEKPKKSKKSKKRKLEDVERTAELVDVKVKISKKEKQKPETMAEEARAIVDTPQDVIETERKSKKDRKLEQDPAEEERRRRKMDKKEKRAKKATENLKSNQEKAFDTVDEKSKRESDLAGSSESSSQSITKESTSLTSAPSSGYSTPMMQGRHAVRSRNIAQKRLASMDVASLNQVDLSLY